MLREPETELMTFKEAAAYCGVAYPTFYTWVRKGVLPHVEVGQRPSLRVRRGDVEQLVRDVPLSA